MASEETPSRRGPARMTGLQKALMVSVLLNVGLLAGHIVRGPVDSAAPPETDEATDPVMAEASGGFEDFDMAEASTAPVEGSVVVQAPVEPAAPAEDLSAAWPPDLQVATVNIEGNIPRSLSTVIPSELANMVSQELNRQLVWNLNPRADLRAGDTLSVAWTNDADGGITIHAMQYLATKFNTTYSAYRFQATGDALASWWNDEGVEVAHRLNDGPLDSYDQITSLLRDRPDHDGMDFMTPVGTPVRSPWAGTVVQTDWNLRYNGNCIEVAYPNGVHAKYLHLSEVSVAAGQTVTAGQIIGESGNTGRSTGPHLHYELDRGGVILDPVEHHGTYQRQLEGADQDAFRAQVSRWQTRLTQQNGG